MAEVDEDLTAFLHGMMPFAAQLDVRVVSASDESAVAQVEWSEQRCTSGGILHGGYLMAVADTVGAILAVSNLAPGAGTATIESKTNFLRAAGEGTHRVTSTLVHAGKSTIVVQTDIVRPDGKLASRTTQTQSVTPPP